MVRQKISKKIERPQKKPGDELLEVSHLTPRLRERTKIDRLYLLTLVNLEEKLFRKFPKFKSR